VLKCPRPNSLLLFLIFSRFPAVDVVIYDLLLPLELSWNVPVRSRLFLLLSSGSSELESLNEKFLLIS